MECSAHPVAKRGIDGSLLSDAGHAAEAFRDDPRSIMVAIAGKIYNLYLRIGNPRLDEALNIVCVHRHAIINDAA